MKILGCLMVVLVGMLGFVVPMQAGLNEKGIPPGVVLENGLKPLVGRVMEMLRIRDECVVRFSRVAEGKMMLHHWEADVPKKLKAKLKPMVLTVSTRLEINDGPEIRQLGVPELDRRLGMWKAAIGDDCIAVVRIRVAKDASDLLFREVLQSLRKAKLDSHVYVEDFVQRQKP